MSLDGTTFCTRCNFPAKKCRCDDRSLAPSPGSRIGILKKDVDGKFSTWKKGERVRVTGRQTVLIERAEWHGQLDIMNKLGGVPEELIDFPANTETSREAGK